MDKELIAVYIGHVLQNFRDTWAWKYQLPRRNKLPGNAVFRFYLRTWHRTWLAKFVDLYLVLFHMSLYALKSRPVGQGSQVVAK